MDYTVHGILQALILKWVAFLLQGDQTVFLEFLLDCLYLDAQSCPTLCDPMNCCPLGSSVHGILQATIVEWVPCPPLGIFSTQGSNPGFPHCKRILFCLSQKGSPSTITFNPPGETSLARTAFSRWIDCARLEGLTYVDSTACSGWPTVTSGLVFM